MRNIIKSIKITWFYYNKNADWVRPKGYKPKKTTSVFWTGMGDMGRFIAEYWARNHGGKTLEMTLEESGIKLPDYTDETKQLWAEASKSFADSAYGDVILINKGFISNSSMWKTIEYEALIKNKKVTSITIVNPVTDESKEIWRRE